MNISAHRAGLSLGVVSMLAVTAAAQTIDNWEPLKTGSAIPSAVRQDPTNANQVWVGYSNGDLYLTIQGRNDQPYWNRLDSAGNGHGGTVNVAPGLAITSVAPVVNHDGYAALVSFEGTKQGGKLWRVDWNRGGLTWTDLTSRLPYGDVWNVSIGAHTSIIYVTTAGGVAYSGDYGATFTTTPMNNDPLTPPSGAAVSAVGENPNSNNTLVGTANGEVWIAFNSKTTTTSPTSWTRLNAGQWGTLPTQLVSSVTADSRDAGGQSFYATFGGRVDKAIWSTKTGGEFWSSIHNPNIPVYGNGFGTIVDNISFSPLAGATTLYATTEYGAFRSDDNGTTWFKTARWSGQNLTAEYKHQDNVVVGNQLFPNVRVKNLGSTTVQLENVKLRYRYSREGSSPDSYFLDYSPYTVTRSISSLGAEQALDLTIASSATVAPGQVSGEIQGRVAKADWSNFDQSNDFSYLQAATSWTLNPYVAVYVGGNQVWGAFAH